ncbi:MAG: hypothetical protein HOP02_11870 [Methylococcaceae bacterium]|nr:hypothetical protein [Methylococcaceae bacterium]
MKNTWALIGAALILSIVLTLSHALLRAAAAYPQLELAWILRVGAALFLYGSVFLAYTVLLKYFDISIFYPIYTALSIVGVSLVGIAYFGETFSLNKILGMLLLLAGIGLISR